MLLTFSLRTEAQIELYKGENKRHIQEFADDFSREQNNRYIQSQTLAKQKGIKLEDRIGDKKIILQQINALGEALYLGVESNRRSGQITRTDQLYSTGGLGLSLSGKSDTLAGKLALWDGGGAMTTHQEFGGRISIQESSTTSDLHATHVAGTLIAQGVIASARGMAFGADLKVWDYNNDNTEISAASPNLLISNHSYGYQAGWVFDSTKNKWQWWGNDAISNLEDYKFGYYDSNAQALDKIAYNAPNYLITKSAGNSRSENGPDFAKGEYYFLKNTRDSSNIIRAKNDSYDIISTTGTAKNILTVGAIESIQQPPNVASEIRVSNFSSWGPTDDGRIKPDIMGVGTDILSTSNTSNAAYTSLDGTSMSSPQVAGSLFLLQQLYNHLNNGRFMRSATLKGLAIHTAMDFGPVGPDYQSGWGLLNTESAAKVIQNQDKSHAIRELRLNNGTIYTEKFIASGAGIIRATLAWTDPEGNVLPLLASSLNNRSPRLVNDLDIKIQDSKGTYLPFTLDPENPSALAKTGVNNVDNVEKITIPQSIPGEIYTLTINHKGTLKNSQQDFSLLLSGIGGNSYCNLIPSASKTLITQVNSDNKTIANTLDSSGTAIAIEIGETKSLSIQFSNSNAKNIRAAVDWNQDGDFDDLNELVLTSTSIVSDRYSFSITSPVGASVDNRYKFRLIASYDPINSSCGSFSNGNSLEASIQLLQASNDLAAISLSTTVGNFCQNTGNLKLIARIKNVGTKTQTKLPVAIRVFANTQAIGQLIGSIDKINPGSEQDVTLQGDIALGAGNTYTFELSHQLTNDQNPQNNTIKLIQKIENPIAPSAFGTQCTPGNLVNLTAVSDGALWYSNNLLVGAGPKVTLPATATYSVAQADFAGNLNPTNKASFGTGTYYENFGPQPILEVKSPIVLESARIYVGTPGTITFSVYNKDTGELVASVTKEVEATRTQSNLTRTGGQLIDDKNDPGQIVYLNLPFPTAGSYLIGQTCSNGASIFRSNKSLADTVNTPVNLGYPYSIPNIVSITGAKFNGSAITTGYYYFYDIKFRSIGCPSPRSQVAVNASPSPTVAITPNGTATACSSDSKVIAATFSDNAAVQWLLNGNPIAGANQATLTVNKSGQYQAQVSNNYNCTSVSSSLNLAFSTPLSPLLSYANGILKSSGGNNMQWYFNGKAITGANEATYFPTESGTYSIKLTDINGCPASSENFSISILANEEVNPFIQITAYPNPTNNEIFLGLPDSILPRKSLLVQLWNNVGQLVKTINYASLSKQIALDVSNVANGNYLISFPEISNQTGIKFVKF
jgi:hypothetical protein